MKMGEEHYTLLGAHHWVENQRAVCFTMPDLAPRDLEIDEPLTHKRAFPTLNSRFKSPRAHAYATKSRYCEYTVSRIHFEGLFCRLLAGDPTSGLRLGANSLVGVNAERNDSNPRNQFPIIENNLKEVSSVNLYDVMDIDVIYRPGKVVAL